MSHQPTSQPTIESILRSALAFLSEASERGERMSIESVLDRFPGLKGEPSAELAVIYHAYRLDSGSDPKAIQSDLERRFPQHSRALQRQFRFAEALEAFASDTTVTQANTNPAGQAARDWSVQEVVQAKGLLGRFEIQRVLGHGGMGTVLLGHDAILNREVAIKVPRADPERGEIAQQRFLREAKIAAQLRHPHLLEILEVGQWEGGCFLATRWAQGGDLSSWNRQHRGPKNPRAVVRMMRDLADGLASCHDAGIVHLDLKPGNVLFDDTWPQEEVAPSHEPELSAVGHQLPGKPMIADFGLARFLDPELQFTETTALLGTPMYMAPEQIECDRARIGKHTDVYAMGLIMYELLAGERPHHAVTTMELLDQLREGRCPRLPELPGITPEIRQVVHRCLNPHVQDRYEDAGRLRDDLQRVLDGRPIAGYRPSRLRGAWNWMQRRDRVPQAALVALTINLAILLSFALTLVLQVSGTVDVIPGDLTVLVTDIAKLSTFPHGPMLVVGVLVLAGRRRWHWANLVLSLALLALVGLALVQGESPVTAYNVDKFAFYATHMIIFGIALMQVVVHGVAVPSLLNRPANQGIFEPGETHPQG
ncbi:MAG: serine/threonine-protein kinase [Planctomycetota bacterium]